MCYTWIQRPQVQNITQAIQWEFVLYPANAHVNHTDGKSMKVIHDLARYVIIYQHTVSQLHGDSSGTQKRSQFL